MDSEQKQRALQVNVAIGWLALSITLIMVVVSTLVKAAIHTDFSEFVHHPGPQGWAVFSVQFFAYVGLAVAAVQYSAAWFRWVHVGLLALVTLYMLLHQLGHMREGWEYGWTGMVDATHHLVGVLTALQALKWARAAATQAAPRALDQAAANC
jgi:hypothetical protein